VKYFLSLFIAILLRIRPEAGKQLGHIGNDHVGDDAPGRVRAPAAAVHPHREDAQLLGRLDVPHEVVAHHPDVGRGHIQQFQRTFVYAQVRLAPAYLLLDEAEQKMLFQREFFYFIPLFCGAPVGDEARFDARPLQRLKLMLCGKI